LPDVNSFAIDLDSLKTNLWKEVVISGSKSGLIMTPSFVTTEGERRTPLKQRRRYWKSFIVFGNDDGNLIVRDDKISLPASGSERKPIPLGRKSRYLAMC
jgi:hypothetical protein